MDNQRSKTDNPENSDIASVRTYKNDVSSYIKTENKSLADIAVAEESNRQKRITDELKKQKNQQKQKRLLKFLFLILGFILIIGLGIVFLKNYFGKNLPKNYESIQIPIAIQIKPVLKETENKLITGVLKNLENQTGAVGGYLIEDDGKIFPLKKIFESEGIYPPGDFIRSIGDDYLIGKSLGGRFMIVAVNYYPNVSAGMFAWEKEIKTDLANVLNLRADSLFVNATTSDALPNQKGNFRDKIIQNVNTRIYTDRNSIESLSYAFVNQKYLIIASDPEVLKSILEKLSSR